MTQSDFNPPDNPYNLFRDWMAEAEKTEPNDPNAMCLSTSDNDGRISSRMILLKGLSDDGFVFYTNEESKKGRQLSEHMQAALCFYWKSLKRQVRVEGKVELVSEEEADAYYNSRHRESRIGAWASDQSRELDKRETFESRIADFQKKFEGQDDIPRPPHWKGYRVKADLIEFWIEEPYRLHRRHEYRLIDGEWAIRMLYP